ncbi:serine hydrolase [Actinosynnema sp. NPDC047251]|uniref:Transcriptional regulator of beta-lactamase n=1 Tax=Saccharothrix espanaensis (strain ATCC 51144 / DSM 44229 / JCM 9112 / NBRC 15066 / NRRL 15764) TaxID=1179773 RepID=K0JYN8_SACES|nr:serine hydrolase [Saccharothrix espanaensis]CCH31251.1 Transcriptional regulator of beta-lactamase [Saccharothrix espanaensis DSM 44229]
MTAKVLRDAREALEAGGLRGSFLVRDLDTGDELGIDADVEFPVASLVKVPLAVATLERVARGELDETLPVVVRPGRSTVPGPTGLSKFRHPATIALGDLLYLSTAISDSVAADALFALTPPAAVTAELRRLGYDGIAVRHLVADLTDTPAERFAPPDVHLAHSLAITAGTAGQGHPVPQLDISLANTGSPRAFVDLVGGLWRPTSVDPSVAARVRGLMGDNLLRQRLAPDFVSDSSRWSSKTGTLLNLRHEVGVVEHAGGPAYAVAAFTESRVPAVVQPGAEALMAHVARTLRDQLRMS